MSPIVILGKEAAYYVVLFLFCLPTYWNASPVSQFNVVVILVLSIEFDLTSSYSVSSVEVIVMDIMPCLCCHLESIVACMPLIRRVLGRMIEFINRWLHTLNYTYTQSIQ
jgi:hypothetical protein